MRAFHPALRPTALEAGADYATQSAHKTLSALSQAAYIHVNDPTFNEHIFRENFNMHTSTSPMYSMIASLDVSRKQSVLEGYKLLQRTLMLADELREQINSTGVFRVLELDDLLPDEVKDDGIRLDPTKVTVDISSCGMTVDDLQNELYTRFNITVEKSTFNTLTLLLTVGTTRSKCSRLYDALMRIAREKRAPRRLYRTPDLPPFTELVSLPRDAYYATGELVTLLDENDQLNGKLAGRISCDQIVPVPSRHSGAGTRASASRPTSSTTSSATCVCRTRSNCTGSCTRATCRRSACWPKQRKNNSYASRQKSRAREAGRLTAFSPIRRSAPAATSAAPFSAIINVGAVGVAGGDRRHDRCIDHAQAADAVHAQFALSTTAAGIGCRAHFRGSDRMEDRRADVAGRAHERLVAQELRTGQELPRRIARQRSGADDAPRQAQCVDGHCVDPPPWPGSSARSSALRSGRRSGS